MKKRLYLIIMFLFFIICLVFFSVKTNAEEGEEIPNEEENVINEEDVKNTEVSEYQELRDSLSQLIESIEEIKNSDDINWFENELINYIFTTLFSIVGTIIVILLYFKKTKLINTDLIALITNNKKTSEELTEEMKTQIEFVKKQAVDLGVKEELITKVETSVSNLMDNFNNKVSELENKLKEQKVQSDELAEIIKIAFLNNTDLVKNGYADKIKKVIEKYENNN